MSIPLPSINPQNAADHARIEAEVAEFLSRKDEAGQPNTIKVLPIVERPDRDDVQEFTINPVSEQLVKRRLKNAGFQRG